MAEEKKQNGGSRGVGMSDEQIRGSIGEMIARHVAQLSEHVTTVQVICTNIESDGTTSRFAYGSGDMYARAKAMEVLLERMEETM